MQNGLYKGTAAIAPKEAATHGTNKKPLLFWSGKMERAKKLELGAENLDTPKAKNITESALPLDSQLHSHDCVGLAEITAANQGSNVVTNG